MPSNGYFLSWYKMLEKHLWNSFLLYLVVEILQVVHKIAVSSMCYIKEVFWKMSQNWQINIRSSHRTWSVKRKDVLKNLAKLAAKYPFQSLFLNKVADRKPETCRSSHWRCCVKQGALKNFANFTGNNLCWSLFIKVAYLVPATLSKNTPSQVLSCKICNYFKENLCMSTCQLYLKRDSKIGVYFRILWIICEHLFRTYRNNRINMLKVIPLFKKSINFTGK